MDPENIAKLIPRGGNKQHASASAFDVECVIEVHLPILRAVGRYGLWDLGPFGDKICQNL